MLTILASGVIKQHLAGFYCGTDENQVLQMAEWSICRHSICKTHWTLTMDWRQQPMCGSKMSTNEKNGMYHLTVCNLTCNANYIYLH